MGNKLPAREFAVKALWPHYSVREIAVRLNTSAGAINKVARRLKLSKKRVAPKAPLSKLHPAIKNRTTRYPTQITAIEENQLLIKTGSNDSKLGYSVQKGRWKGSLIFSVTLIERATCPSSCKEWLTCYGNNMQWAKRYELDRATRERIEFEVDELMFEHWRQGILLRLHVLGDFGKTRGEVEPYVSMYVRLLARHPKLRIFGFTAHRRDSHAGKCVHQLNELFPDQVRIRFSHQPAGDGFGSTVLDKGERLEGAVVCPVDAQQVRGCSHCALCWSMRPAVVFWRH